MFLVIVLAVSIAIALVAAISVDTMYHAVIERRWIAVLPGAIFLVACIALLV